MWETYVYASLSLGWNGTKLKTEQMDGWKGLLEKIIESLSLRLRVLHSPIMLLCALTASVNPIPGTYLQALSPFLFQLSCILVTFYEPQDFTKHNSEFGVTQWFALLHHDNCVKIACSPYLWMAFLRLSPTVQKRACEANWKLVCRCKWLFVCGPAMNWQLALW